ncbi:TPA: hypothetical protein H1016_04680 [archaeon]|uniref:Uncharacterized protein n=1 Tax=Candidatus Naiadarchaeum limnaeum TaxID=2756139 RepID=A0A832UW09_9ARCH|nr:hypothetical protein [Candidatus Naiadarchaeum limnaeum]
MSILFKNEKGQQIGTGIWMIIMIIIGIIFFVAIMVAAGLQLNFLGAIGG